jgi:hypothetical protein
MEHNLLWNNILLRNNITDKWCNEMKHCSTGSDNHILVLRGNTARSMSHHHAEVINGRYGETVSWLDTKYTTVYMYNTYFNYISCSQCDTIICSSHEYSRNANFGTLALCADRKVHMFERSLKVVHNGQLFTFRRVTGESDIASYNDWIGCVTIVNCLRIRTERRITNYASQLIRATQLFRRAHIQLYA